MSGELMEATRSFLESGWVLYGAMSGIMVFLIWQKKKR